MCLLKKGEIMEVKVEEAARELGMSKFYIYRLPKDTPGLYRFGRALRVNVQELRDWAKGQARVVQNG